MNNMFKEFKRVFPDEYVHLGMDEVYYACWNSSPVVAEFMKQHNWTSMHQFEQYHVKKTIKNVKDMGYKYILYQDPADNKVKVK